MAKRKATPRKGQIAQAPKVKGGPKAKKSVKNYKGGKQIGYGKGGM